MLFLEEITREVRGRALFSGLKWTIHPGERIGLVGPNGSGKTTLLRIMAGRDEPDGGRVRKRKDLRIAYLPQEVESETSSDRPLIDAVLAGADRVRQIEMAMRALEDAMVEADAAGEEEELLRLTGLYGEQRALFEWAGGDDLTGRARSILGGLGFAREEQDFPISTFSGGWRMRALMARMLLSGADLLLLDEPTNHLDLEALTWLETHLAASPAALVVVSHDRVFLDRVVGKIADLVRHRLRLTTGGYAKWYAAREAERLDASRRDEKLAKQEAHLARFVERFRYKASKARQAQSRIKAMEKIRSERESLDADEQVRTTFRWPDPPRSPDVQITLEGVGHGYGDKRVFSGVDVVIRMGERIAIHGPNGAGKSTLLKILSGEIVATEGRRIVGHGTTIGTFAQHHLERFDPEKEVREAAEEASPGSVPQDVRRALGAMGLDEEHFGRTVATLSGGERARLALARLLLVPAAVLLLDEPTNHLDLPLREALEEALADWPGTLIVVSHDRAFLSRLTTRHLRVADGAVHVREGTEANAISTCRTGEIDAEAEKETKVLPEQSREARRARARATQERSRLLAPLKRILEESEQKVSELETRLEEIDAEMVRPEVLCDGDRMRRLTRMREELNAEVKRCTKAWEDAAERMEEIEET